MNLLRRLYDRIPDWLWPHLTGGEVLPPEEEDQFGIQHAERLADASEILTARLGQVDERVRNVDSKLVALLTLTSVLSTAVAASLAAATTLGNVDEDARLLAWIAVAVVFYANVQILRSLWSTVGGLTRRSFKELAPGDFVPRRDENGEGYRTRLLNLQVNNMCWNEWVVDQKVSDMAVAHVALKNALTAVSLLVLLALAIAISHLA